MTDQAEINRAMKRASPPRGALSSLLMFDTMMENMIDLSRQREASDTRRVSKPRKSTIDKDIRRERTKARKACKASRRKS